MRNPRGFTMIEALIVVVIIGIVGSIVTPKVASGLARGNVLAARAKVISLYARARGVATESGRTGILVVSGNNAYVVARPRLVAVAGSSADTVTKVESLYQEYKVTASSTTDSVRVGPSGIGQNADTIVLTKSGHVDTVFINQFGQVRK